MVAQKFVYIPISKRNISTIQYRKLIKFSGYVAVLNKKKVKIAALLLHHSPSYAIILQNWCKNDFSDARAAVRCGNSRVWRRHDGLFAQGQCNHPVLQCWLNVGKAYRLLDIKRGMNSRHNKLKLLTGTQMTAGSTFMGASELTCLNVGLMFTLNPLSRMHNVDPTILLKWLLNLLCANHLAYVLLVRGWTIRLWRLKDCM